MARLGTDGRSHSGRGCRVQGDRRLLGRCFYGDDVQQFRSAFNPISISICFNQTGIAVTDANGVTTQYGAYLGWNRDEGVFAFTNGTRCDLGALKATIQRAAKVRVGCCKGATTAYTYALTLGEQRWLVLLAFVLESFKGSKTPSCGSEAI